MNNLLNKVKKHLDKITWTYEYCGSPGSDVQTACNYLETQSFSINKIEQYLHHAEGLKKPKQIAAAIADPLAWDRISRFLWNTKTRTGTWSVGEGVTFKAD